MKLILTIMTGLLGAMVVCASESSTFERANERFSKGDFAGAVTSYEEVIRDEGTSAAVLYNLGNSYQRLGQPGPAILAYERARLLSPRDPDLLANLALARKASAAQEEEVNPHPRLEAALGYLSRHEWSWLVVAGALWIGLLSVVEAFSSIRNRRGFRGLIRLSGALAVVVLVAGTVALYLRRDESSRGVIVSESAVLRLSPFEKAESLATPGPGKMVRLGERKGDYVYVEIPGLKIRGWISTREVAAILPENSTGG